MSDSYQYVEHNSSKRFPRGGNSTKSSSNSSFSSPFPFALLVETGLEGFRPDPCLNASHTPPSEILPLYFASSGIACKVRTISSTPTPLCKRLVACAVSNLLKGRGEVLGEKRGGVGGEGGGIVQWSWWICTSTEGEGGLQVVHVQGLKELGEEGVGGRERAG